MHLNDFLEGLLGGRPPTARRRRARRALADLLQRRLGPRPDPGLPAGGDSAHQAPDASRPGSQAVPQPSAAPWFEVRCHRCGVIEDCVGAPHKCLIAQSDRRMEALRGDPTRSNLVSEIADYLSSDQGRYDALVAALIIRAR